MFLTKEDTEFDHEEELRTMAVLQVRFLFSIHRFLPSCLVMQVQSML